MVEGWDEGNMVFLCRLFLSFLDVSIVQCVYVHSAKKYSKPESIVKKV